MEIVKKKIEQIHPYERNPRRNEKAIDAVVQSIKEVGYISPIITDEDFCILAGHTRYAALRRLGWKECDVIVREGLTDEQKRKYRLYDNKSGELSEWDFDLLIQEMEGLDFSGFDIDFELPLETDEFGTTEFVNKEFSDDSFSDEEFTYLCPSCGFRFN